MKHKHNMVRLAVVLAMLIVAMSMMAQPGVAANGIRSATLSIYVNLATDATVNVHRITAPWTETGVTWNNFGGSFAPEIVNSFVADGVGWRSVDVTALVQDWFSGVYSNYGLLLEQGTTEFTRFYSSESSTVSLRPKLEICFSGTGCVTIQRGTWGTVADAYIWASMPDRNGGASPILYTGLVLGYEKQSLLWFELPPPPPPPWQGCTPGYWKNLRKHGDEWDSYTPGDDFEVVFGVDASFDPTDLGSVVRMGGGGEKALARHAVAALLNATSPDVSYYYSEFDVIGIVVGAYALGTDEAFEAAKDELEFRNADLTPCPLH
ncbi:MAG: DNRLRE domain-containing protein [Desulfobacteraceae bacterium]|nr:DNRLRE domain-containing protein [Desulfobacteraceae bacterium]